MKVHNLSLTIGLILFLHSEPAESQCISSYFNIIDTTLLEGSTCIKLSDIHKSFSGAIQACQIDGANLAEPGIELQSHLRAMMRASGEGYWVGGSDVVLEELWKWLSGVDMNSTSVIWSSSPTQEPDGGTTQNCAAMEPDDYFMHSENCDTELYYVCQMVST